MLLTNFSFNPPIIAHRGLSSAAPENTLAAFHKAKELGLKWVEFDVMLTQCGTPVIIHDEKLMRTTNGSGMVADLTYETLKELDAGSWFHASFAMERIPTLLKVLQQLDAWGLAANVEIKARTGFEAEGVEKILKIISEAQFKQSLLISSFSYKVLEEVKEQASNMSLGFLMHHWQANWEEKCNHIGAVAVDVNHAILNPKRVRQIKQSDRWVLAYTVNSSQRLHQLLEWGVDAVFSDCPKEILLDFIAQRSRKRGSV